MRERGLKSHRVGPHQSISESLPVRERGLKTSLTVVSKAASTSLPVRERGLKKFFAHRIKRIRQVAPRAGAWIEEPRILAKRFITTVAPRAGAWIEDHGRQDEQGPGRSLPVRERGLKIFGRPGQPQCRHVAPRAGAWIEDDRRIWLILKTLVAPRAGAWIEECSMEPIHRMSSCRSPCGSVD